MRAPLLLSLVGLTLGCGAAEEPAPSPAPPPAPAVEPAPVVEPVVEPETEPNAHADWYACTAASDCVLVPATCGGSTGANVAHAAEVTAEQEALRIVSLCAAPTAPPLPTHPDCVANVCVAVPDELPTAES